jgi:6-phosphogluconolactonase (cycloisomerase 2 family)
VRSFIVDEDGSDIAETSVFTIPASNARGMEIGALGEAVYFPITSTATNPADVLLHCKVAPNTGKVTLVGFVTAGSNPTLVHAAPNGKHLYVTDPDEENLNIFNIAGVSRGLTLAQTDIPVSPTLSTLSFSADGSELYLSDTDRSELVVQSLNASTGTFEESSSLFTRPGGLRLMQAPGDASPVLRINRLYGLNETGSHIKPFEVDAADGSLLDTLTPTLVPSGTPSDMTLDPQGRFLFTGSRSPNGLDSFSIEENGEVTDLGMHVDLGVAAPLAMALEPTGQFLYVACDTTQEVHTFAVSETGALTLMDTDNLSGGPTSLSVSPGGEFVYVTIGGNGSPTDGTISVFRTNALNGDLAPVTILATPGFPNALTFSQSGEKAYVSLQETTGVQVHTVNEDGTLTAGTETNSQPLPNDVTLTIDGRFAYVTFTGPVINSDGLLLYEIDSETGVLHGGSIGGADTWADAAFSGDDCSQSLVSHDGRTVYVLASGSDEIWCFDTDADSGQVSFKAIAQPGTAPVRMVTSFTPE